MTSSRSTASYLNDRRPYPSRYTLLFVWAALFTAVSCGPSDPNGLKLTWNVLSVDAGERRMTVEWRLLNQTRQDWKGGSWSLHWNQLSGDMHQETVPPQVKVARIGGDYHQMTTTPGFDLPAGGEITFQFETRGLIERVIAGPVGVYLADAATGQTFPVEFDLRWRDAEGLSELGLPTAESRYMDHADLVQQGSASLASAPRILHRVVPVPVQMVMTGDSGDADGTHAAAPGAMRVVDEGAFGGLAALMVEMFDGHPWLPDGFFDGGGEAMPIVLTHVSGLPEEGYRLTVSEEGATVEASTRQGALYGLMSLSQLALQAHAPASAGLDPLPWSALQLVDEPFFAYRGMHFDIGRNYFGPEKLTQLLDFMAFFKLNNLHLNLTEDEGWRIEIPGLPELTQIGSRRGHTADERDHLRPAYGSGPDPDAAGGLGGGSGHLTREAFIDLLRKADARGVRVIPEVNSPGHSRAAVVAMRARAERLLARGDSAAAWEYRLDDPDDRSVYRSAQGYTDNVVNVCLDGSFRFFTKVLDELQAMYGEAGLELEWFHMGGDEMPYGAWQRSPMCAAFLERSEEVESADDLAGYYVDRVRSILSGRGIRLVGWEDILLRHSEQSHNEVAISDRFIGTDVVPYVWNASWGWGREDMTYRFANRGFDVVMSNSSAFYFDMTDDADPENYGLDWSGTVNLREMWNTQPLDLFRYPKLVFDNPQERREWLGSKENLLPEARDRFLGIQAQMWTETIRNEQILDEMMMPNLAVFATRAWSRPGSAAGMEQGAAMEQASMSVSEDHLVYGWNRLALTLSSKTLPMVRETFGGMAYDLPKPGGVVRDGMLHANHILPGTQIRYTLDGSDPNGSSPLYTGPVAVPPSAQIRIAAFDHTGRSGRPLSVAQPGDGADGPFGG